MKILVTGGAGFIGSHVADAYIEEGHEVAVVDNLHTGKKINVNPQARFYQMDIRDPRLAEVFAAERPDYVNHHAALASVRESMEEPILYADVNVLGSLHLLELCRQYGVSKFIYASTGGAIYGNPQYLPADEAHPVQPLDFYGASKHHVEHYLELYRTHYGIRFVSLRYGNVYGPRQDPYGEAGVVAIFIMQMLTGKQAVINGDGTQERDFVYVGDVARANVLALERGDNEMVNIGIGIGTSINEIFARLAKATQYTLGEVHGPPKLGEVYKTYLTIHRAKELLGWAPEIDLATGLQRTIEFFKTQL